MNKLQKVAEMKRQKKGRSQPATQTSSQRGSSNLFGTNSFQNICCCVSRKYCLTAEHGR